MSGFKYKYSTLVVIFLCNVMAFMVFFNAPLKVDEVDYYPQILKYVEGDYSMNQDITAFTTYHALLAIFAKLTGLTSVWFFRAINMLFAFVSVIVFMRCAALIEKKWPSMALLQFAFFPIIFPYFFLIYTDILSLLMILIGLYFFLKKNYHWAAIFAIIGSCVRQNNIVWLAFFCLLSYGEPNNWKFGVNKGVSHLIKYWTFTMGFILFVGFVIINKGVAIGDRSMHPPFAFQLGNIYFLLFCFWFVFLPLNLGKLKEITPLFKKYKWLIPAILIGYIGFILTFNNSHPFNYQWGGYFLRNRVLIFFNTSLLLKSIYFIVVLLAIFSISQIKLEQKSFYLLYPMIILYLLPSWLIEQRYYIIPFALFLLFRKEADIKTEKILTVWLCLAGLLCFIIINSSRFFL